MVAKVKGPLNLFDLDVPKTQVVDLGLYAQRGVRQTFNLADDIVVQSKEDARDMIQLVTVEAINEQLAIGNEPTRFLVDGSDAKNLRDVQRRTDTFFGNTVDQLLITNFERTLRRMILKNTKPQTGNLSDMRNWDWYYLPFSADRRRGLAQKLDNPRDLEAWSYGDRLLIRPSKTSSTPEERIDYASVVTQKLLNADKRTLRKGAGIRACHPLKITVTPDKLSRR